jgi:hypothetical protein
MENISRGDIPRFKSPEEEISFLREQISIREKELNEKKYSVDNATIVQEQISKYRNSLPKEILDETYELAKNDIESIILNLEPERHDKKMEELLGVMNKKGLKNAMSVLTQMKDPHLEDDFHRFLVQYILHYHKPKIIDTKERGFKGVGMTLYEIVLLEDLTRPEEGRNMKSLKELISGMEQFLSGMMSIVTKQEKENHIVLEIANANGSDQFVYYVAVPTAYKGLFEKQIMSIFYTAKLTEITNDYNIFNEDGVSVGSILQTKNTPLYPCKTYESFDNDPINVVLNSFSKIKKDGEGATIQIIFAPKGDYFNKRYEYSIEQMEKGVPAKEATNMPESISADFKKSFFEIFKASAKDEKEEEKKVDTDAIQRVKNKLSSPIVATNVRVVASSFNRQDAENILHGIESSFNQFTDTSSNEFVWKRLEKNDLQKMFRNFSFRNYNPDDLLPLNLREVATLIHFNTTSLSPTHQLKQSQSVTAPAPSGMKTNGTYLGVNSFHNEETKVYIQDEDRLRHMYVIGQTGTGKTVFLKNMIIQDIQRGNGCCFIDPHGTDILDILANIPQNRFQDVIYFDPSYTERPMALNMLEYDPKHPEQKTFVVNELLSIFQKLYGSVPESMGPAFQQYFRNAAMLVVEDPETGCTLLDISRVLSNKSFRDMKISRCKNPVIVEFWKEIAEKAGGEASLSNIVPYIVNKFDVFLANEIMRPIVAQEKSSFNFRDIMDNKKILLINLSKGRLGDINANLIGLIIVGKILMAALSRVDDLSKILPPFYLYIDEFQNITTDSISSILSEARKYKLSLTVAHQFIAQLEENIKNAVFGNVGSLISFRISAEDAEFVEKQFSPAFSAKDIMSLDNLNACVKMLVNGRSERAFNLKEPFPPKGNPSIVESLKQLSYLTYGGNRQEVEQEILKKYKK